MSEADGSMGARLAQLRSERDQSLQHVADAVGVSKAHIWELERGSSDNPGLKLLRALAQHFRCPVAYLIGEVSTPYPAVVPRYNGTPESDALRLIDAYTSAAIVAQREAADHIRSIQAQIDGLWGRSR